MQTHDDWLNSQIAEAQEREQRAIAILDRMEARHLFRMSEERAKIEPLSVSEEADNVSSLFDSRVYQRRNETPWAVMSLSAFMKEMAYSGKVSFSCVYRPSVASRQWYTIEWTDENGDRRIAEAQEWDLCLWRAAQTELQVREQRKTAEGSVE